MYNQLANLLMSHSLGESRNFPNLDISILASRYYGAIAQPCDSGDLTLRMRVCSKHRKKKCERRKKYFDFLVEFTSVKVEWKEASSKTFIFTFNDEMLRR